MAWPVVAWLAFVLVGAFWFRWASPELIGPLGSEVDTWNRTLRIWALLLSVMQGALACLLIGAMVLEDSATATKAFWRTRPIAPEHMVAAKAMAAVLCFIVAPVVMLIPVWLSVGCTAKDVVIAVCQYGAGQGALIVFALAVAAHSRNLAAFLVAGCVFGVLLVSPRGWTGLVVVAPILAVVLYHQYRKRRAYIGWVVMSVCAIGVATFGSGRVVEVGRVRGTLPPAPPEVRAAVAADTAFTRRTNTLPDFRITTRPIDGIYYVSTVARTRQGTIVMTGPSWGADLAAQAVGAQHAPKEVRVRLYPGEQLRRTAEGDQLSFSGSLELWRVRPVVVGELPLRVGAELATETGRVRILVLNEAPGELKGVSIEEREVAPSDTRNWPDSPTPAELRTAHVVDCYFLVDRSTGRVTPLSGGGIQSALNQQNLGIRHFRVDERNWLDLKLVKVRLYAEPAYDLPIEVDGVVTQTAPDEPAKTH